MRAPGTVAQATPLHKMMRVRVEPTHAWGGAAPSGWQSPTFDDRHWRVAAGQLLPRAGLKPGAVIPEGVTVIDMLPAGALLTRTRFAIENVASARVLELRITYLDGFIAYLNGTEIARRNVPATPADANAAGAHGSDPERIFLPLPLPAGGAALSAKDNLLAVEVRPAAGRAPLDANAPSVRIEIGAAAGVRIVRGPYLIAPTDGEVSVAWETDLPARGKVFLSAEGTQAPPTTVPQPGSKIGTKAKNAAMVASPDSSTSASTLALRQVVRLTNLAPGQRYQYRVEVEADGSVDRVQSALASFETAPHLDRPLRFIVYGDMRAPGHANHAQIVAAILRDPAPLIVNTGDLVAVGSEESAWQRYFEITAPLGATAPVVPALGNHESYVGGSARSWALFGLKSAAPISGTGYGSFDWGGAHFVILDSNRPDAAQLKWMVQDIAGAKRRRARAIFAVAHAGPWAHGPHGGSRTMEREFAPALAAAGVDVLFSGHDHIYERGIGETARGPLPYVVSGGGGAPLYNPTCRPASRPNAAAVPSAPSPSGAVPTSVSTETPTPLPACPASVAIISKNHHYIVVEVDDRNLRMCPRLSDGGAVEPCVDVPLRTRRR